MLVSVPNIFESNRALTCSPETNYAYTKFKDGNMSWAKLLQELPKGHKVLLVARHGQGFHNIAYAHYGEEDWDNHWSKLDGDSTSSWFDAHLSPVGITQVERTGSLIFEKELGPDIVPDAFYSSPLRRCLETFKYSWSKKTALTKETPHSLDLHILENLRETLGEHTCDKRQPQAVTIKEYSADTTGFMTLQNSPEWPINMDYEPGFSNEDQLWKADHRELDGEMDLRLEKALNQIWNVEKHHPDHKLISITCHEGVIRSILRVLKHEPIPFMETSGVVALVVKEN